MKQENLGTAKCIASRIKRNNSLTKQKVPVLHLSKEHNNDNKEVQ